MKEHEHQKYYEEHETLTTSHMNSIALRGDIPITTTTNHNFCRISFKINRNNEEKWVYIVFANELTRSINGFYTKNIAFFSNC